MHERPMAPMAMLRALRLLDPLLAGLSEAADTPEADWLPLALLDTRVVDEERLAKDFFQAIRAEDTDALEGLFHLAQQMVFRREGIPHVVDVDLYHEVGYEIDTDLLIAARIACAHATPTKKQDWIAALSWPSVLNTEGFAVDAVLARELADTHVHLGGALPGSFYWIAAMAGYARLYRMHQWSPQSPGLWIDKVRRAERIRRELFEWLRTGEIPDRVLERSFQPDPWKLRVDEPFCDYILHWLIPDAQRRSKYNPILGERWLLWSALWSARFEPQGFPRRKLVEYVKIRNSFIRHLSHGPGVRGLERFQTTFRRQHLLFDDRVACMARDGSRRRRVLAQVAGLERYRVRHALRYQFSDPTDVPWARDQGAGLEHNPIPTTPWRPARQVELRVTPTLGQSQLRAMHAYLLGLRDFVQGERDAPLLRVGFVFHVHRYGAAHAQETAMWQFQGLLAMLRDEPGLRPFVVGIDTAGAEMSVPPRDFAKCYALVRQQDLEQIPRPGFPPIKLGQTCHAGEDFRDLLTGLRYVDDAIALLGLRAGDRIGHGIALALAPATWYDGRRSTFPLLRDHILDLLWARWLARRHDPREKIEFDSTLDYELSVYLDQALAAAHRRSGVPQNRTHHLVQDVLEHWHDTVRFPTERSILSALDIANAAYPWELRIHSSWPNMVARIRDRVLQRVVRSEVVIEVCPTSNLLVGGFHSYTRLPYLNLNQAHLPGAPPDDPRIPFSINSDDPGIFRTTVANEYRLLGQALVRLGYRRHDVAAWLDDARAVGVDSTFIPKWSPPTREELLFWLRRRVFREPDETPDLRHL